MKYLTIVGLVLLISSCASQGDSNAKPHTIAQGAEGTVDYCVTLLGTPLFCVKAERSLGDSE